MIDATPLLVAAYVAMPGMGVLAFCCFYLWREEHPKAFQRNRRAMAERVKK